MLKLSFFSGTEEAWSDIQHRLLYLQMKTTGSTDLAIHIDDGLISANELVIHKKVG